MKDYEESHPWITFKATDVLSERTWMLLGEARAICEQISSTPLRPSVAWDLEELALIKGVQATTAIEGNTLNEEQVRGIYREEYTAPPSRAYQEREVRNVFKALAHIDKHAKNGTLGPVTADLICGYNRDVLDALELSPDVRLGEFRDHSVVVGTYRGAPARDCRYLTQRLADWLESGIFNPNDPETDFAHTVVQAVFAHLYIAWIHPFGDGNGRTARLLEYMLLARSGRVPLLAAHLLSNHYNLTRTRYYWELEAASRLRSTSGFVAYAVQGLVDGLRDQLKLVREQHLDLAWTNYVNKTMDRFPTSKASDRQRALVHAMPPFESVARDELTLLTPALAALYARTGPRTLSRDLNRLLKAGLIRREGRNWKARTDVMFRFMPPAAPS